MYEADTQPAAVNVVANCVRRHEWHDGEFYLDNRLEFAVSATLAYGYLAMLTVEREDYQNPDYNITTAAHRAPYWYSENISDSGFGEIEDKSHYIKLSGPNRHGFEVEVIEGWDKPGRSLKVSNAPTYNKVYFDFFGENYTTSIGEILHARTRYRIMRN